MFQSTPISSVERHLGFYVLLCLFTAGISLVGYRSLDYDSNNNQDDCHSNPSDADSAPCAAKLSAYRCVVRGTATSVTPCPICAPTCPLGRYCPTLPPGPPLPHNMTTPTPVPHTPTPVPTKPPLPGFACPRGGYCLANTSCVWPCPAGSYCQNGSVYTCPAGHFCRPGAEMPTPCNLLDWCPSNEIGNSTTRAWAGAGTVLAILLAALVVLYLIARLAKWCLQNQNKENREKLQAAKDPTLSYR